MKLTVDTELIKEHGPYTATVYSYIQKKSSHGVMLDGKPHVRLSLRGMQQDLQCFGLSVIVKAVNELVSKGLIKKKYITSREVWYTSEV